VTAKIPGPTGLATTGVSAGTVTLKWTYGSSLYLTDIMVDTSTASALGSSRRIAQVPPATTRYVMAGTNAGVKQLAGVRHADPWGGLSTQSKATFTCTTAFIQLPPPRIFLLGTLY
jgi:hypothetical protein